jgi:hypothetical protein
MQIKVEVLGFDWDDEGEALYDLEVDREGHALRDAQGPRARSVSEKKLPGVPTGRSPRPLGVPTGLSPRPLGE